jgi:hypothetical protein
MEKRIILPKTYLEKIDKPVIFLAGPIRDAVDWQEKAIDYILEKDKNVLIANPRWNASYKVREISMPGKLDYFERQRSWELHYLDIASKKGAVLFWLANAPGFMTRLELGQSMVQYVFEDTRFCVGGEKEFSDLETIRYDLKYHTDKEIYSTLEKTCDEAIKLANRED